MTEPAAEFLDRYQNELEVALLATIRGDKAGAEAAIKKAAACEALIPVAVRDRVRKKAKERAYRIQGALENAPEGSVLQGVFETKE